MELIESLAAYTVRDIESGEILFRGPYLAARRWINRHPPAPGKGYETSPPTQERRATCSL